MFVVRCSNLAFMARMRDLRIDRYYKENQCLYGIEMCFDVLVVTVVSKEFCGMDFSRALFLSIIFILKIHESGKTYININYVYAEKNKR